MSAAAHIAAETSHARRGAIRNAFRYKVDFVRIDPEAGDGPLLFSRRGFNLASVAARDYGDGRGAAWAREALAEIGLPDLRLELVTQPRFLGLGFNPVSFWLAWRGADLLAVIAEVNNTFGDRHAYICARPDLAPITPADRIEAAKLMHVSPFQQPVGRYAFTFNITADRLAIRIAHTNGDEGVIATLTGDSAPLTSRALIRAALRRPLGSVRTWLLIHAQALKLKLKGARYLRRPAPPERKTSRWPS